MSEEVNEINALKGGEPGAAKVDDWEAKFKDMERRYNAACVEQGRVKKLDAELKARDAEIAELKAARQSEAITSALSEQERSEIPDEVLNAATKLVSKGVGDVRADIERRLSELEARKNADNEAYAEQARRRFVSQIEENFPGFISSTTTGGDKAEQWVKYQRYNAASIKSAIAANDFDALAYHIKQFYTIHLGVPVPSGDESGSAAPDPRSYGGGGGVSANQGKVYTQEEYIGLYDEIEKARARGDYAEMKRLDAEIKLAPAEGRVKQ